MDNAKPEIISYYEHEAEIARSELHARRWMIATLIAFVAFVGSNVGWLVYESQYQAVETETYTAESDGGSVAISNKEGTINYGIEGNLQQDENEGEEGRSGE